jgi:hypothetical protein
MSKPKPSKLRHKTIAEGYLNLLVPRYASILSSVLDRELTNLAGDTKAGTLIAKDRYGNKYFENLEDELPCELP